MDWERYDKITKEAYEHRQKQAELERQKRVAKLYYFAFHVRGSPVRMLLSHAGIEYEDHIIEEEKWDEYSKIMPNNEVPALYLGDQELSGKGPSLLRFLGKKYGYYPDDPTSAGD